MPETDEEKKKRWAKSAAMAYMTPAMAHAMAMSKYQSQNKYKEQFNKTRGKGYTAVTSTPELDHARTQSVRVSQNKYKSDFEKNKSKFTQVTDNPELLRVKRVTNQVSKVAYEGKGSALAERRRKREDKKETESTKREVEPVVDEVPQSYGRPLEVDETIQEEGEPTNGGYQPEPAENTGYEAAPDAETGYGATTEAATGYDAAPETGTGYEEETGYDAQGSYGREAAENGNGQTESYGEEAKQYTEADIDTQHSYGASDGYEQQAEPQSYDEPAPEQDEEVQEISEGGLDDFYANLG